MSEERLFHDYFNDIVDLTIVWQKIEEDLNPLETTARKIFSDLYNGDS